MRLNTGPDHPATHWKQTVVPLPPSDGDEEETFEKDDIVGWQLRIEKAQGRRYDISVGLLDPSTEEHPAPCDCKWAKCELIKALLKEQEEEEEEDGGEDVEDIS